MNPLVGVVPVPARNSFILMGLTWRTFSAVAAICLPPCPWMPGPWFVHEALPIRSPLKGTGPEVTLKVAFTLAPGATESNVCDVRVVPVTKEAHCRPGTEMLSRTPTAGDAPVFVNVTVLSCEDPGANVWSPGGVLVSEAGVRLSCCTLYLAATMLA